MAMYWEVLREKDVFSQYVVEGDTWLAGAPRLDAYQCSCPVARQQHFVTRHTESIGEPMPALMLVLITSFGEVLLHYCRDEMSIYSSM